jgi:hypothetical protein
LLAANVEPYLRADGTKVWSLMQLESEVEGLEHAPRLVHVLVQAGGPLMLGCGQASVVAPLMRFRRLRGVERQRLSGSRSPVR